MGIFILRSSAGAGGGSEPAFGDVGFNAATQQATGTTIVFDFRQDYTSNNMLEVTTGSLPGGEAMLRAPTYTHLPTGGYWGSGAGRFIPGNWESGPSLGQHICGIKSLSGFNTVLGSNCRQLAVGKLFRFGSGWISEQDGTKEIIFQRTGDVGGGGRPMIIPKTNFFTGEMIFPACDDEICNCSRNPADDEYGNDTPNPYFDYQDYFGQWVWLEWLINMDGNWARTYIWTADGVHNGTFMTEQDYQESGTAGSIPGLDNVNFLNPVASPTANCWKEINWFEIRLGSSTSMTPPRGFPGSAR